MENIFPKSVRVKFELVLNNVLVPGVKILLTVSGNGPRIVWINFRYDHSPRFYYHCGLITHDTKLCRSISSLNVGFE